MMGTQKAVAASAAVVLALAAGCGGSASKPRHEAASPHEAAAAPRASAPVPHGPPYPVGLRVVRLVDRARTVHYADGTSGARTLVTYVRYPAVGVASAGDRPTAPPELRRGRFPLVVFGHGFDLTPAPYARLLRAWASAGYVVAAPVFPLENADAPGGPDESDLVNQPRDVSFVISAVTAPHSEWTRIVDAAHVAVAGHSDGGETALAVAYDSRFRDARVRVAMILSGAKIPGIGGFSFPSPSPPLLATQGTADTVNPPTFTHAFYDIAPPPKYLLTLIGAEHIPPYSDSEPQLGVVGRVTTAFLDLYLKRLPGAATRLRADGTVAGVATLYANP